MEDIAPRGLSFWAMVIAGLAYMIWKLRESD